MRQLVINPKITLRNSIAIDSYLNDINKLDLISQEEEVQIAKKIKNGDEEALNELVRSNLRFVVSVAKQYQGHGLSLIDLINEGNLGLIKAAKRFDESKGFKFITYAVWWIRQYILTAIGEQARIVRLPHNKVSIYHDIQRYNAIHMQKYEREATPSEIANALNISVQDVQDVIHNNQNYSSLDSPLSDDSKGECAIDFLEADDDYNTDRECQLNSLRTDIKNLLQCLSPRERTIVELFYGLSYNRVHTLEEISLKYQISKERVRQLKDCAINRLKQHCVQSSLNNYLCA